MFVISVESIDSSAEHIVLPIVIAFQFGKQFQITEDHYLLKNCNLLL